MAWGGGGGGRSWVVRLSVDDVDRGISEVRVLDQGFELSHRSGQDAPVRVQGADVASVAQEWAGLQGRIHVILHDGARLLLEHGVMPGGALYAALVAAAGGPNDVRSE